MEFFEGLDPLLRGFWYVAIPVSVIFLIQMVLTFIGMDSSDGLEPDFDADFDAGDHPFQLFSLRNLINFLLGFSWTGISLYNAIPNPIVLISIAVLVGCLFIYIYFLIISQVQRLAEDNSFKMSETLNKTAEVYLSIPAHMQGKGKVLISIRGSSRELMAMTENERIETGAVVKVVRIENNDVLIVNKL